MFKYGVTQLFGSRQGICSVRYIAHSPAIYGAENKSQYKSIKECYAGKSVFLTGGTGFLGKVLIQKLLHNTDVEKVYVLVRPKKGIDADKRLKQMLDVPIFEQLKEVQPNALSKVVAIGGELTKNSLGISPEDEQKIIDNVHIVFHSAATVKFSDSFSTIIDVNYNGTKKVLKLGKKIKKLETFLYISTAYSQGDKKIIDEVLYPRRYKDEEVNNFIDTYGDNPKEILRFIDGSPNTYTLSKYLCENHLNEEHKPMPTIILRPAIVTPAYKDPIPGWVDSWVAATAFFSDVARGLTKFLCSERNVVCDMIPVDYVCNLAIVAAARGNKTDDILVYNSSSSTTNPMTWKMGADLYFDESIKQGKVDLPALKPRKLTLLSSPATAKYLTFTLQTTPAFLADLWLRVKGEKPRYLNMQKRANALQDVIFVFAKTSFEIKSDKALQLLSTLDEKDKILFQFDAKTIIWRKYMRTFYEGVQKYMLNNK